MWFTLWLQLVRLGFCDRTFLSEQLLSSEDHVLSGVKSVLLMHMYMLLHYDRTPVLYTLTWTWEWESATLATLKQVQIIIKMKKTKIREKCARHKRTSTRDSLGRFSDTSTDPRLCRQKKIVLHSHSEGFTASVTLHSVSLVCKILNPILMNLACKVLTPFLHTICNLVIWKSVEAFKQITSLTVQDQLTTKYLSWELWSFDLKFFYAGSLIVSSLCMCLCVSADVHRQVIFT